MHCNICSRTCPPRCMQCMPLRLQVACGMCQGSAAASVVFFIAQNWSNVHALAPSHWQSSLPYDASRPTGWLAAMLQRWCAPRSAPIFWFLPATATTGTALILPSSVVTENTGTTTLRTILSNVNDLQSASRPWGSQASSLNLQVTV